MLSVDNAGGCPNGGGRSTEIVDLLGELDGAARRDREELLRWLLDHGFTLERIRGSLSPMLLPANRVLGDDGSNISTRELAESTGIEMRLLQRLEHAVGLPRVDDPDGAVLARADAQSAALTQFFVDFADDEDEAIAVIRLLTEGLARAVALIRQTAFKLITKPGTTEVEMARTAEALALQAAPRIAPMMDGLMRMHLRQMFEAEGISAAERATGELPGARQVAVAFADLAGFTRLGEAAPPEELARVAGKLADLTHDIVTAPVRFIKTIGDAVMLTSPEPLPLLVNVTQLVDAAVEHRLPQLRAGVAMGPAVSHGGDWFGSPVNIASRVTAVARPGTVLAAEPMWSTLGSAQGLTWEPAGTHELRGVTRPLALYSVRRATAPQ